MTVRTTPDPLMIRVGARVRSARGAKGITRQALSDLSGVSSRYLAQLESGAGNISISLLGRVANALDRPVDWLVRPEASGDHIGDLFARADPQTQAQIMRQLAPQNPTAGRGERIALIGLRGAGKSTLGKAVGAALNLPFVELNKQIETSCGMPIAEIMALYGPDGYRKLEATALTQVTASNDRMILAVAGGIVSNRATFAHLCAATHTIWLRAAPEDHMDRVRAQGDMRPMEGNPQAMDQLRSLLARREVQYSRAGAVLETSGRTVERSIRDLLTLIRTNAYVAPT